MKQRVNIVGWGGGGQTYIMGMMKNKFDWNVNPLADQDLDKHCQFGVAWTPENPKFTEYKKFKNKITFYVYCNPVKCIASHYRRSWQQLQKNKMTGVREKLPENLKDYENLVVSEQRDPFMLYHHYVGWAHYCPNLYPIMLEDLVKYKNWSI